MDTGLTYRVRDILAGLSMLILAIGVSTLFACSDKATNSDLQAGTAITQQAASPSYVASYQDTIEGTMQISPHMINLQSKGTAESIRTIIGLAIPAGYYLTDFDFTLSFNDEDVTKAYDCYYCYVDDNLIISFRKSEVLSSPVTLSFVNTEVVAAVNGYFRLETEDDGYGTWLSTVANVEIISPAQAEPVQK